MLAQIDRDIQNLEPQTSPLFHYQILQQNRRLAAFPEGEVLQDATGREDIVNDWPVDVRVRHSDFSDAVKVPSGDGRQNHVRLFIVLAMDDFQGMGGELVGNGKRTNIAVIQLSKSRTILDDGFSK